MNQIFDTTGKNYGSSQLPKLGWTGSPVVDLTNGPGGGPCIQSATQGISYHNFKSLVTTRITVGLHWKCSALGGCVFQIINTDCVQWCLTVDSSGRLIVTTGGSSGSTDGVVRAASPINQIIAGITYRIEVQVVPSTSATGSIIIKVNEQVVITQPTVITCAGTNGSGTNMSALQIGNFSYVQFYLSNIYVNDDQGTSHTTFEGDVFNEAIFFNSDGPTQDWDKSDVGNPNYYSLINGNRPDNTKYLTTLTSGDKCLFGIPAFSSDVVGLKMLRLHGYLNKSGAGVRQIKLIAQFNADDPVEGTLTTLTDGDQFVEQEWDTNPTDNAALGVLNVAANTYGIEIFS